MIEFNYYLVTSYINDFPFFTTCASVGNEYFRITDLKLFLSDGKSGVSNEKVIPIMYIKQSKLSKKIVKSAKT